MDVYHAVTVSYCALCEIMQRLAKYIVYVFEDIGYARATSELSRMGYHKEAATLREMRRKLKN